MVLEGRSFAAARPQFAEWTNHLGQNNEAGDSVPIHNSLPSRATELTLDLSSSGRLKNTSTRFTRSTNANVVDGRASIASNLFCLSWLYPFDG